MPLPEKLLMLAVPLGMGKVTVLILTLSIMEKAAAQSNDTSLVALNAQSFFFNVLEGKDGRVYAGSSDGVFEVRETEYTRIADSVGYIKLDKDGRVRIDPNGIKFLDQKTLLHLLPYPNESRDETHAMSGSKLYIVSGGRMHVFEIRPYSYTYRNHSIRSISRQLVGTYSGIYHRGRRLPDPAFPEFTDGYIREYNGKVFIPYDNLNVYDIDPIDSTLIPYRELPVGMEHSVPFDIHYVAKAKRYFITTFNRLLSMDSAMKEWKTIHETDSSEGPVVFISQTPYTVFFSAHRDLLYHNMNMDSAIKFGTLPEKVMDGAVNGLYNYVLCPSGLYRFNRSEPLKKLVDLNKAHTLLPNRDGELVIGTDAGLIHYDIKTGRLSTLVKGVEFNRRALALLDNHVHAGSINGLYTLDNDRLQEIIRKNAIPEETTPALPGYALGALAVLLLATLGSTALYLRTRRKYETVIESVQAAAEAEDKPKLSREDIETFIRADLTNASLKSIKERFKTTNAQIYSLLNPEKPGNFIKRLRMEIVQEMRAKGASAKDISQKTGLSESYVRRVWNN